MEASGCFYPGPRPARALNFTPVARDRMRPSSAIMEETPSTITALHQKLDMVIAGNLEQKGAIEELGKENAALKAQLREMSVDMHMQLEANHGCIPRQLRVVNLSNYHQIFP